MHDCGDPRVMRKKLIQPLRRDKHGWRMVVQIAPFLAFMTEPVGNDDLLPVGGERRMEIRSDEAGTARDQYHGGRYMEKQYNREGPADDPTTEIF